MDPRLRGGDDGMLLLRHLHHCPTHAKGAVIALGNFDGVHPGHKAVIRRAVELARENHHTAAVMTFEPHPLEVLRPERESFRLLGFRAKFSHIAALGVDVLFCPLFTPRFASLTGASFIQSVLHDQLHAAHIVIGYDFIFGHNRSGNAELLSRMAEPCGYRLTQVEAEFRGDIVYSSTAIRNYLREGKPAEANRLLGYPYYVEGKVMKGDQRGRTLGFPTINLRLCRTVPPRFGVYAGKAVIENTTYVAAINIGIKPTFGGTEPLVEAYLFDCDRNLYGRRAKIELHHFLRSEHIFENIEKLKAQMKEDCARVKEMMR